jgi:hypothetical protein
MKNILLMLVGVLVTGLSVSVVLLTGEIKKQADCCQKKNS